MHRFAYFIRKTYITAIFIILEVAAIRIYAYSTPYTQAQLLSVSNSVVGALHGAVYEVGGYFSLRRENIVLTERIAELQNRVSELETTCAAFGVDTTAVSGTEKEYIAARVVTNSINRPQNFITLNKGIRDGVVVDMAVVTPEGFAVGCVVRCSENFSVAMTMLNTDFRTGGSLLHDGSTGLVHWRGGDSRTVQFDEVSKYAAVAGGDSVVTAGISYRFPTGVLIGTVESVESNSEQTSLDCRVRLAADMARLRNVVLVNNTFSDESRALENNTWAPADAGADSTH